jgi:hypothetical protein
MAVSNKDFTKFLKEPLKDLFERAYKVKEELGLMFDWDVTELLLCSVHYNKAAEVIEQLEKLNKALAKIPKISSYELDVIVAPILCHLRQKVLC